MYFAQGRARVRPRPVRNVILIVVCSLACGLGAGSLVSAHAASCSIDASPLPPTEEALFRGDLKQAESLLDAARKSYPEDQRIRAAEVALLLEQGKLDDARKQIDDWTKKQSASPWLMYAAGEERFASGDWLEAYALMNKALHANPCMAEAYDGAAHFEMMAGYRATARRHLSVAHQLEPNNDDIRLDWVNSLDPQQRAAQMEMLSTELTGLSERQRAGLEHSLALYRAVAQNSCELVSSNGPTHIPMQPILDPRATVGVQSWGLEVAINGHKRLLEIDTGATGLLLSHSAAGGTELTPIENSAVGGFGGEGPAGTTLGRANRVQIGGLEFKNCAVEELNSFGFGGGSQIQHQLDNLVGLIGTDIFARYMVTLDYVHHEVRLDPLPTMPGAIVGDRDPLGGSRNPDWMNVDRSTPASMAAWTKIYTRGHEVVVPVAINAKTPALFIVDTGNFTNVVDRSLARQVTKLENGVTVGMGVSGISLMSWSGAFTLDFAGLRLPNNSMETMNFSRFGGVSGFLGYPTLSQLIIHLDYRDDLALFEAPEGTKLNPK